MSISRCLSLMGLGLQLILLPGWGQVPDIGVAPATTRTAQHAYYVSPSGDDANAGSATQPFRTLNRAQAAVRTVNRDMAGDIVVFVRGGLYELEQPLVFDERDSGAREFYVTYSAYPGERPVVSGGRRITGWEAAGPGVFRASTRGLRFRQLRVNHERAIRARSPNAGTYYRLRGWDTTGRRLEVERSAIEGVFRLDGVEINVQKQWNQNIMRIASMTVEGDSAVLTPAEPERGRSFTQTAPPRERGQPYHLENAREFLDAPGEWHLDAYNGHVFYRPRPGEEVASARVVAPRLPTLVLLRGTLSAPVRNIRLSGLTFEHTTWLVPSDEGFIGDQAGTGFLSRIRHMGGHGVLLHSGTSETILVGNAVTDVSGNGIAVDMNFEGNPRDRRKISRGDVVRNNYVARVGQDYYGSVGILAGYTQALRIEHNEVVDMPYTGISVGWGWSVKPTTLRENVIRANRVHRVMTLLSDGGAIYTLSRQPGTVISENYVHDLSRAATAGSFPIAAIYLDQGSNFITVRDNVLLRVPTAIHLNRVSSPGAGTRNVLIDNAGASPRVIAAAGLEAAYRDIAH